MIERRWIQAAWVAVITVGALAASTVAAAAPGDPDGGFGTAGVLAGIAGSPEDVFESSGKLYTVSETDTGGVTSNVNIRVFLSTGAPDTSFSGDGALDVAAGGIASTASIAVDGSGRVVVAAGLFAAADNVGQKIWRFEADGDPDTSFDGDGIKTLPFQAAYPAVMGLGFQSDGDLLIGANDTFIVGGLSQLPQIVRLTEAGATAQTVDVLPDYNERGANAVMEVDGNGRPYVLVPDDGLLTIRRYTTSLALDSTYSGDGVLSIARPGGSGDNDNWGGALDVSTGGVALVAGTVGSYTRVGANPPVEVQQATLVAKVSAAGVLDSTFSTDGIAAVARPSGSIEPTVIGPTGSGGAAVSAWRNLEGGNETTTAVWQLTAAGTPETGFSGDGRVERAAWGVGGTTSADGGRIYLYEYGSGGTGSKLAALQLVKPAAPGAPGTPAAPKLTGASATSLNVSFTAPANGGSSITSFDILTYQGSSSTPVATQEMVASGGGIGNFQFPATGLTPNKLYRFKVRATNAVSDGPLSAYSAYGLPPFSSVDRFVKQQYTDFLAKAPTASELSSLKGRVEAGTVTPAAAVAEVAAKPEWATLDPLTRIYYAYFGRAPDSGGLKYWLGKRRTGTKVSAISNQFVTSNEFKNKYGSLSNRAFVELVYQNVLGRPGDTAGINSWTAKLDNKTRTRGEVMVQFSESSEHIRRRAGEVNTVSVIFGMLLRSPSSSELTTWVPLVKTTKVPLIEYVLAGAPYDNRIPSA